MGGIGSVSGVAAWQQRLSLDDAPELLRAGFKLQAEAIAADAKSAVLAAHPGGSGALADSIAVSDESGADGPSFSIGTDDPAGWYLEFGTRRMAAAPWLIPALQGRLGSVKQSLQTMLGTLLSGSNRS